MVNGTGSTPSWLRSILTRLHRGKRTRATAAVPPVSSNSERTITTAATSTMSTSAASTPADTADSPTAREHPSTTTEPFICVPLYIYPAPSAWEPLLRAARANPAAHFHAVVNPHNGPGDDPLPDENYLAALRALAALPNVRILGYVHVTYGRRPAREVRRDVEAYAAWAGLDAGLRVDGVFFDEAPSGEDMVGYVEGVVRFARRALSVEAGEEDAGGGGGLMVLNPGVVVPRVYYEMADYVVAFEQAHGHWDDVGGEVLEGLEPDLRAKTVVMVHSCGVDEGDLEGLAHEFREEGIMGQYVTSQMEGGYSEWPPWWDSYVEFVFEGSGGASDGC